MNTNIIAVKKGLQICMTYSQIISKFMMKIPYQLLMTQILCSGLVTLPTATSIPRRKKKGYRYGHVMVARGVLNRYGFE